MNSFLFKIFLTLTVFSVLILSQSEFSQREQIRTLQRDQIKLKREGKLSEAEQLNDRIRSLVNFNLIL